MNTLFTSLFLFASLASTAFAQNSFTINTPQNVVACQPSQFTWTASPAGGPYYLSILPAGQPNGPTILDLGKQTDLSYTWTANISVGTGCFLELRDASGTQAQSGPFTIGPSSPGSSCTLININPGTNTGGVTSGVASGVASPSTVTHATSSATASVAKSSQGAVAAKANTAATSHYVPAGTLAMVGVAALALLL